MRPVDKFLFKHNPVFIKKNFNGYRYGVNNSEVFKTPGKFDGVHIDKYRAKQLIKPGLIAAGVLGATGLAAAVPAIIKAVRRRRQLKRLSENV